MSKKWFKLVAEIITLCSIGYVVYIGYFVFFNKPVTPEDIIKLYLKMGYAYVTLAVVLILRAILRKSRIL
ncbi:hypothetical protein M3194_27625 [Paenibacillus glycanilyticus]|uniref:hypothetical protein n=1 Tax=Paenibacillus glycanilyticus TaxID=126569 RepID=UPI00203D1D01|nr:hypothetical protein [Paenibacillus glycanilyticus]MCM3631087.1 hypothetical protein [Paenibacillus glycanilyticus]